MDFLLRCNSLKCRAQLNESAVVTTCSHIFCVSCSESLGLSNPNSNERTCPACETQLSNVDDAVVTQLHPTEEYKTSVLSGLSPSIIMECAGRGLSFYSYQTTQEIIYQEYMARTLTDKYSTLSSQMDKIIHDGNAEISSLRDRLSAMHTEQKGLEKKNHELAEAFRDKAKAHQQALSMYTKLKQQQLAAGMELAAEHNAENVLHAAGVKSVNQSKYHTGQRMQTRTGSNGSGGSGGRHQNVQAWQPRVQGSRAGLQSSRSAPLHATPSSHRTQLPGTLYTNRGNESNGGVQLPPGTPHRAALNNVDPNIYGNITNTGYGGMSAGIKVGRPQNGHAGYAGVNVGRSHGVGGLNVR